jgi:molecular chaperone DnaK (HSP70)
LFDKEELLIFLFYINNIIKVLSIKGKEHLGGIDIDNKLCVYYMNIFKRRKY